MGYVHKGDQTEEQLGLGHGNAPLPNMKEITERDWARSDFFNYDPAYQGYRQICQPRHFQQLRDMGIEPPKNAAGHDVAMPIRWYMFHDKTGIALYSDWWEKKVRYFSFAVCIHEYTGENIGRCLNRYTCNKCKYVREVDSSD